MGGGEHHEPFKVPDYRVYDNWRSFPQLVQHEKRLAQFGLKDPWIRNYVWIYDTRNLYMGKLFLKSIGAGFKPGLVYAAVGIIITEMLTSYYSHKKHHDHAAHGGHHGEHHEKQHGEHHGGAGHH